MSEFAVQRSDTGKSFTLDPGEVLNLRLPDNHTAGYQWMVDTIDPKVLALRSSTYTAPQGDLAGGSGMRTILIDAVAAGETLLRLATRRGWEKASAGAEEFEISVLVR